MSNTNDIAVCVKRALDRYFADLDGEAAAGIYDMVMNQVERPMLESVMHRTNGNQSHAAQMLGITRNTLRRKLTEHGML
jgi:Fis family transcriptional regulator, factor for inversion stimulation protein